MATLTPEQKKFLVVRAAMFERGCDIIRDFDAEYGFEPAKEQVHRYQFKRKDKSQPNKELRALYDAARAAFLADVCAIPIANRAYRLQKLNDMFHTAIDANSLDGVEVAAKLVEQAAKEVGDVFTNKSKVEGKVDHEHTGTLDFSAGENRALLADALTKALELKAPATTQH